MSPAADQLDCLAGQATGGLGREAGKLNQTVGAAVTGEDLPPHKISLVEGSMATQLHNLAREARSTPT